ncbi:hypothetical protein M23134_06753 [Microscilla marina ATCC 23134]|uniref:Uncharacterized protein n=1 Tax=Microscilla marina ATCC 23134 TaxID=313606 RepID=A1ZXT3_MICM2|nr:hypothetical protein M23134_06753 [Microscilla marina ATCC 23134]
MQFTYFRENKKIKFYCTDYQLLKKYFSHQNAFGLWFEYILIKDI